MSNTDSKEALAKEDAAVRNLSKQLRLEQKNYSQLTQLLKIKEAQSDIFQKFEEIKNTRNTLPKFLSSPEDIETTQQVNLNYVVQKARGAIASFQQNRLERQLQAKGIDTADLVGAQQQAQKKPDVTQSYINHHRGTGQKLRQQRRTEVLDDFQTRQNGIGKIRDVSSQGFGLANKAFDTGKKLLLPGIKFEQQMSGVQAQLGLDSGDQRLIALRQQATSRAAKGQSAQDVTQAQSALASAGYNPQDVLAAVPAALNLAKASGSSIDEAVKALSGIRQAFQLPADQAENIADVMAKASSSYQLSLSDLDKKMQAAAPAALKNGMGLEQTAAQLAPQGRSLGKVDGAAQAIVTVRGDNLDGDIKKLFASWDRIRIDLFTGQDSSLRQLTQTATGWLNTLAQWSTENPALANSLMTVGIAITALLGGLSTIGTFIVPALSAINMLMAGAGLLGSVFTSVGTVIAGAFAALSLPIVAVVAAIIGGAALIYKYWEPISAFMGGVAESFSAAMGPISDAFSPVIAAFNSVMDTLRPVYDWFKALLTPIKSTQEELDTAAAYGKKLGEWLVWAFRLPGDALNQLIGLIGKARGFIDKAIGWFGNEKADPTSPEYDSSLSPSGGVLSLGNENYRAVRPTSGPVVTDHSVLTNNVAISVPAGSTREEMEHIVRTAMMDVENTRRNQNLSAYALT
jgi:hypothetical protein